MPTSLTERDKPDDLSIQDKTKVLATQENLAQTLTLLATGLAMASLVVGGVGVLALMLMSVKERATEIGLRIAVGARSLSDGMRRISGGDLDVVLPVSGQDEFAMLTAGFNDMVSRVKQMILARDQLLLDASHELRSPLTRMKVALALLADDSDKGGLDSDLKEMEAMIAELLELERLRSPNGLRREKQDLVPILQEVARSFEGRPPGIRVGTIASQSLSASTETEFVWSCATFWKTPSSIHCLIVALLISVRDRTTPQS